MHNQVDGPVSIANGERRSHHRAYGPYSRRFVKYGIICFINRLIYQNNFYTHENKKRDR
jgi:hypothetical protein